MDVKLIIKCIYANQSEYGCFKEFKNRINTFDCWQIKKPLKTLVLRLFIKM